MFYKLIGYCVLVGIIQTYLDPVAFVIKFGDLSPLIAYALIGIICRFAYEVVKKIVGLLTLPFAWMSFGILGLVINIILVYLVQYAINHSDTGLIMISPSIIQALGFAGVMMIWSMLVNMFV